MILWQAVALLYYFLVIASNVFLQEDIQWWMVNSFLSAPANGRLRFIQRPKIKVVLTAIYAEELLTINVYKKEREKVRFNFWMFIEIVLVVYYCVITTETNDTELSINIHTKCNLINYCMEIVKHFDMLLELSFLI